MNEKNGRFLCSLCSIWSLGTALAMALLPALGHSIGFWKSGGYILTAALLLQLLLRKKWLLPTILGGGMLMGLLLSMLIRQNTAWLRYWNGFFSWWHSGCPQLLPYSGGSALFWVRLLTVLPAVGLLILLEQLPVQIELPVVLLGGSGLLIWLYLRKEQALIAVAALLCVRVLTDLSRLCGRQILRTLGGQQQVSAAGMRLCAFLMAGAAALCAVLILPDRDGEWRWDALVQLTEDIGDLYLEGTGRLSADSGFSIGISGWMPLGEKLGGDIQPNNDILLRVKTDTPTLLAGAVYNTYDGASWTDSGDLGRYRYGSLFWRGRKNEVFGTRLPSGRTASRIFDSISRTAEYTVSSGIYTAEIFTAGRLQSVEPDKEGAELYFNRQGELFLEERKSGQRYTLTATVLTRDAEDFDRQMLLLEETLADKRDSHWD